MAEKHVAAKKEVTPEGLRKAFGKIQAAKQKASEFNGEAGKAQQKLMQDHGLDRAALAFVLKLDKMETINQQGTLRGVIEYAHKAGMFDEIDAFDDIIARMKEIADEVEARRHNQSPSAEVVDLAKGAEERPTK